jgi:hypothetical protein
MADRFSNTDGTWLALAAAAGLAIAGRKAGSSAYAPRTSPYGSSHGWTKSGDLICDYCSNKAVGKLRGTGIDDALCKSCSMKMVPSAPKGCRWEAFGKGRKGSGNDDDVEVQILTAQQAQARRRLPTRYADPMPAIYQEPANFPQLRRTAELELPDRELARRIMAGTDVLGTMTFDEAAQVDPRRIDALISQRMGRAFSEVFGMGPGPEAEMMYLEGIQFARNANGGQLPASAVVSLIEENTDRALFATWPRMPSPMRAELRRNLHVFDEALDDAKDIAARAARATRGTPDNVEWSGLVEWLEGHKGMMRAALAQALPGPVGGQRPAFGGPRRMLPGPRRR